MKQQVLFFQRNGFPLPKIESQSGFMEELDETEIEDMAEADMQAIDEKLQPENLMKISEKLQRFIMMKMEILFGNIQKMPLIYQMMRRNRNHRCIPNNKLQHQLKQ